MIRIRRDILHGTANAENTGGGRSSLPGDPTGTVATLLITHRKLEQMERVKEAIEFVVGQLPEDKKQMIKLRYWTRPQTLTWEGIAQHVNTSRITVIRWRDEIIKAIADRIGWR